MKKILLIEDNPNVLLNTTKMLQAEGYIVISAGDGRTGLEMAQQHIPSLIICDIMMPELDGYGVISALRTNPATTTIPFIFLSAKSDKNDFRQGMELGSDDYLTKPFSRDELLGAINAQFKKQDIISSYYKQELDNLRGNISKSLPHQLLFPAIEIMGLADILVKNYHAMQAHEVPDIGKRIRKAGRDMHEMVKKFLLYAELESTESNTEWKDQIRHSRATFVDIEMTSCAKKIAENYNRLSDLQVDVADTSIRISDSYLTVIVKELVDNAFKFSAEGSAVEVVGSYDDQEYCFKITDHGQGIEPDQLANFGAYIKFEKKLYIQQGTGLGLAIAKRLLELHGGRLEIESVPYEQTVVKAFLPLSSR
ncbi:hybrid sensor histidine kinase/response regulator [Pseudanabaena mucicola]|uniref:histidine kinase n=1 Tax=Pseudanabaena mucicola FACHB-723 TaxID=2692860 RepID=A0ABR7ZU14_9CYAN|nr:response regulator [Pseudanabaena mucicola]MBD2187466.1 response regulator [Pseudanabaena mucicola FACHB-723]